MNILRYQIYENNIIFIYRCMLYMVKLYIHIHIYVNSKNSEFMVQMHLGRIKDNETVCSTVSIRFYFKNIT